MSAGRLLAFVLALWPLAATAGTYGTLPPEDVAVVEVLPGWRDGSEHYSALRIRLAPGWKTYWRAPGDAGIPPSFSWAGSDNLAAVRFIWPVPTVFRINGQRSLGYRDEVVLPMLLAPSRPGAPITLRGEVELGVCHDVCIPVTLLLGAEIPASGEADPRISAALASGARTAAEAGLSGIACTVEPIRDGLRLTARIELPRQGGDEVVVVETGNPAVWVSETDSRRDGATLIAAADLVPPGAKPFALDRSTLRITVIGGGKVVDIRGCPAG